MGAYPSRVLSVTQLPTEESQSGLKKARRNSHPVLSFSEEEEGPEKGERLLGCERSWEFPSSGEGSFLPRTFPGPILFIFHPQNKPSPHLSPTFGPIFYKFIVLGLLGLGSFTSTVKDLPKVDPPKVDPTNTI